MKIRLRKVIPALLFPMVLLLNAGCDNSGQSNFTQHYVLDGWMPLGHPIAVRLTHTVDIEDYYDAAAVGVPGATVTVWESLNGDTTVYVLIADTSAPPGTYRAPGDDDTVKTGYDYAIRLDIGGNVITAETHQAPPPFVLDSVKIDTLRVPDGDEGSIPAYEWGKIVFDRNGQYPHLALYTLFYRNSPAAAGINVIVESTEPDWYDNDDLQLSGNNGPPMTNIAFWTLLIGDTFALPPVIINFQGQHRVRAMNCDSIGYEYCQTIFPGQTDWNPPSNVSGAFGLFSVYDADTSYFCVTDPEADVLYSCGP